MAVDGRRHVVAFGGLPWQGSQPVGRQPFRDYLCGLTGRPGPRIAVLTTATGDDPAIAALACGWFEGSGAEVGHLALFPMPSVADPEDFLLSRDLVFVGGGSVANMLAVWRVHQLDRILRAAWQAGVVLAGVSAGAICWFEGGTTDSFGPDLRPFTGGLALLAGSYCPHYDSEPGRRPLFTSLIAAGVLPAGIACDDGAGAHFVDDELDAVVSGLPGAAGYLVEPDGAGGFTETALAARPLPGPGP
ncbi:MAG TPA: peptidase E [Streptosporangiaceae bacterium]|nr:peptidase E [Streptosporangiaceae bacterium]